MPESVYAAFKALHVTAIILFVAGLLVQSLALRVRAAQTRAHAGDAAPIDALTPIVRAWDGIVTVPSLVAAIVLGFGLAQAGHRLAEPWVIGKLAIFVALAGLHGMQAGMLKRAATTELRPAFAKAGAIVVALTLVAVLLAVFKPR